MLLPYTSTYGLRLLAPLFPDMLWRHATDERVAYLTFDDGPTQEMTGALLDLLARYDARATFFLLGAQARAHPELVRALVDGGHALGNHTWAHPDAWRTPARQVLAELDRTTAFLEDLVQQPVRFMRPPYGHFTGTMRRWCREQGQCLVMWDVMPGDFLAGVTARYIEHFVRRALRPGSVVVLHDNPIAVDAALPALRALLPALTAEGWRFEALS